MWSATHKSEIEAIKSVDAELELYQDGSLTKEELTQVVDNPLSQVIESNAELIKLLRERKEQRVL